MKPEQQSRQQPIAIIGIGCLFPKAEGLGAYWANIKNRLDAITEVPNTHWRPEDYLDADPKTPDMTYAARGGFLDPVDFHPLEFGIAPKDIEATDTSQLLGMMVAAQALEDAGYGPNREFSRDRVSVVMGVTGTLELVIPLGARLGHPIWKRALDKAGVDPKVAEEVVEEISSSYVGWQENSFPGLLGNVVAGRIANRLDLHGTNCVVDAACASSLSAVHLATLELAAGRADMVVTGGIDTFNDIFMYMCFSKTPALSNTGDSRPFDAKADGTILGEGLGVLVLKRLEDAKRDGDRVYAVIRSIGTSSDGKGNAIYAPSAEGQLRCLRNAYSQAGVTPDTVELVEAHGTGTKVGDATEIKALTQLFSETGADRTWCAVGSVKSQVGHTKAAAGVAGVIKATLALHHKVLPPTIKVDQPIENLVPGKSPLYVNTEKRPWLPRPSHPRRAGVSAFGFGGSNFHCVLEEFGSEKQQVDWDGDLQLLAFSADDLDQLKAKVNGWSAPANWNHCRSLAARSRNEFDPSKRHRLVLVLERDKPNWSGPLKHLVELLGRYADRRTWSSPDGIYYSREPKPGKLAALFPGQGAQYLGMMRDLACTFPVMQRVLAEADRVFHENHSESDRRLSDFVYPPPLFTDVARAEAERLLRATEVAQPAIGAVSVGAALVLSEFGIQADAFAGHSYGELPALCAAGRFDTLQLHRTSMLRGKLMAQAQGGTGGMLAVKGPLETVEKIILRESLKVVVANKNSPQQVVLSGAVEEIERAEAVFRKESFRTDRLAVSAAFHSELVADASGPFQEALREVEFRSGGAPVFSNTTGREYPTDEQAARELLGGQLALPVEFVEEIRNMYAAGVRTFVEVGPGARLTGLVNAILEGEEFEAFSLDGSAGKRSGMLDLARTLAHLAALGYSAALDRWDPQAIHAVPPKRRGMAIKISGANHFEPKPRAAKPVSPQPVRREPAQTEKPREPSLPPAAPPPNNVSSVKTPSERIEMGQQTQNGANRTASPAPQSAAPLVQWAPSSTTGPVAPVFHDGLIALQKMQQQTAQLHQQFLQGQMLAQQTFQQLLQQQAVSGPVLQTVAVPVSTPSSLPQPPLQVQPQPQVPSTPQPQVRTQPQPQPQPQQAKKPTAPEPNRAAPVAGTTSSPKPAVKSPTARASRVAEVLMQVVAEKTGYPAEMLELQMDLDGDLGIDSIKRVEILSALQEQLPDAPQVKPDQLGAFRTLQQVVDYLSSQESAAAEPVVAQPVSAPVPVQRSDARTQQALLEVVAEKTGYPAEMLELDMGLDADLGIDSIKRVEILSALQERLPDAPTVQPEQLGSFQTLRQIADFLAANNAGDDSRSTAFPAPAAAALEGRDQVQRLLLQIVAEKTGYPAEMLDVEMGLDADLGIDSIKRVEILSAIQELLPNAPTVQPEQLGSFQTLGQIVDFLSAGSVVSSSSPAASTVENAAPGALAETLLQIVADKTGYPVEMLELDMGLDSDLGIDSIKRVEILSALQEKMPHLPAVQPEQLGALQTLRQIVELLGDSGPAAGSTGPKPAETSPAPASAKQETEVCDPSRLQRLLLNVVPLEDPNSRPEIRFSEESEVWITPDDSGLDSALAQLLEKRGARARLVSMDEIDRLEPPAKLGGLVVLAPSREPGHEFLSDSFRLAKRVAESLKAQSQTGDALLVTVSKIDGRFGLQDVADRRGALTGGLAGLAKTAQHEWEGVHCKAIDIPHDEASRDEERLASMLADEICRRGPLEVGLSIERQFSLELTAEPVPEPSQTPLLHAGDVVVVTGGARGVTAEVAVALARQCRPTLVLLGRSPAPTPEPTWAAGLETDADLKRAILQNADAPLTPKQVNELARAILSNREISRNLERIQQSGAEVVYRQVDVTNADAVSALLQEIRDQFGPVKGLVHGAGVIEDRLIVDKTDEQFRRVYDTKVRGVHHLLGSLHADPLKILVLFSSSTARFGRVGQVDYAISNEILNKLAQHEAKRRPDCRVVSVNWGPWDGGMVAPSLRRVFESEGVGVIPLRDGAEYLLRELGRPGPVEVVLLGPGEVPIARPSAAKSKEPETKIDLVRAFERLVSVENCPVLRSHVIGGRAVLPVALMMEWLGHAALHLNPGLVFGGIEQLRVLRGLRLEADEEWTVELLSGKAEAFDGSLIAPVALASKGRNGKLVLHAQGSARLLNAPLEAPPAQFAATEGSLKIGVEELYPRYLFHGPAMQGIHKVEGCNDDGISVVSQPAGSPKDWIEKPLRGNWLGDPLALDVAFQAMIVWCWENLGAPSLPTYFERYRQYARTFPRSGTMVHAKVRSRTGHQVRADFEFVDSSGRLVASLDGYECTVDASLEKAFRNNRLPQNVSS